MRGGFDIMLWEIHYGKYINEAVQDKWKFYKCEAKTSEEAINKLKKEIGDRLNYVLSCVPIEVNRNESK